MSMYVTEQKNTPINYTADVLVVGGGPAGSMAAIAAAREGAKTILLERTYTLGGTFTNGLVSWVPVDKMGAMEVYHEDKPVQSGLITELIERLYTVGGAYKVEDVLRDPPVAKFSIYNQTDPELAKVMLQQMAVEAGVKLLYGTLVVDVIKEGDKVVGVIFENKSGRQAVKAKVVIDASGDGDVAAFAGAEYQKHDKPMKMSLMAAFANIVPEEVAWPMDAEYTKWFQETVHKAIASGDLEDEEADGCFKELADVCGTSWVGPMWYLKAGSYPKEWYRRTEALGIIDSYTGDATNAEDLTAAEIKTRSNLLNVIRFFRKYIPGFEKAYIAYTASNVGVRESRRVVGDFIVSIRNKTPEELSLPDVVVKVKTAGFDIATYTPEHAPVFDIPYRSLYPKEVDGMLIAGRCISIDHDLAIRLSPRDVGTCMCIGQAAGTAAALCASMNIEPRKLDYRVLQSVLAKAGVNVDHVS